AEATADVLRAHGLEAVRLASVDGSHPYVIGEWMHAGADAPTVLLYAHHDVQPPGIVENWESDPFEPVEREGRLYGRGSADDKAGAVAHAHAVSAWLASSGALPCNVRVLIDDRGDLAIDGLWDDVDVPSEPERAPIAGLDDDPDAFGGALGLRPGAEMVGDPGRTLHERLWFRPSVTVIGIDGHPIKGSSN